MLLIKILLSAMLSISFAQKNASPVEPLRCSVKFHVESYTNAIVTKMRYASGAYISAPVNIGSDGNFHLYPGSIQPVQLYIDMFVSSGTFASNDIYFGATNIHCNPNIEPLGGNWYRCNMTELNYGCQNDETGIIYKIHLFSQTNCHN